MISFLVRRLVSGLVLLFAITTLTFVLIFSGGANIARNILGKTATQAQVVQKTHELGLDQPVLTRYLDWLGSALRGDFGTSWLNGASVTENVLGALPVTLSLVLLTMLISAALSVLLGTGAAVKRGWLDRVVQVTAVIGHVIPQFIVAIILVGVFAVGLGILPATGYVPLADDPAGWALSLVLPVAALVLGAVASTAQQVRSSTIEVLRRDYVRTLTSRGLGFNEILYKHVLRSAAPAGLTNLGLQLVALLGGTVLVEQIFALPGIGSLTVTATAGGDLPVVMGIVFITVFIVILINLLIDLAVGWLNPKARVS
ncbi:MULTISPECIES: ABC transporter permease [unclassified Leifsonia]|uniref:ABC transporter permease n=1 Tax=unclassified Leifsonia TaxID=2663824 RepID=UPI0008A7FFF3|nr:MULTISPECIES: ABC transporter permease [unclassified Leifsonia]SEI15138.1 peptide/nickel transport system permease protein [Leifsonia sp. CL154]SFM04168.1 peptide/nickel transport system permease protein [Leifsonia sp. CL147]